MNVSRDIHFDRFQVLWKSRYQVWPRMEEGASHTFKVPPHSIEFTLPSPKIGVEYLPVVDPPWMPYIRTGFQEVTLNQDTHVSNPFPIITAAHQSCSHHYFINVSSTLNKHKIWNW